MTAAPSEASPGPSAGPGNGQVAAVPTEPGAEERYVITIDPGVLVVPAFAHSMLSTSVYACPTPNLVVPTIPGLAAMKAITHDGIRDRHIVSPPIGEFDRHAREVARYARRCQYDDSNAAANAVAVIRDPNASPPQHAAASADVLAFIQEELRIDIKTAPPSTRATNDAADLNRIDPFEYYIAGVRLLGGGWKEAAVWPFAYLRTAILRAASQYYRRQLKRQREEDLHREPEEKAKVIASPLVYSMGIDLIRFLGALRAKGKRDAEVADDIERWLAGASKADLGEARYRRMMYHLRGPRLRALAQRFRLDGSEESHDPIPISLPFGTPPPGWRPGYRTEWGPVLQPSLRPDDPKKLSLGDTTVALVDGGHANA